MWKKNEDTNSAEDRPEVKPAVENRREVPKTTLDPAKAVAARASGSGSTIGASLTVTGAIKGNEDLLIQGAVEGEVVLPKNTVVVGAQGKVEASIEANVIKVEGEVIGDMTGLEQVVVMTSGTVRGNIMSPRVILEDGAKLKGSIDMDTLSEPGTASASAAKDTHNKNASGLDKKDSEKKVVAPIQPSGSH